MPLSRNLSKLKVKLKYTSCVSYIKNYKYYFNTSKILLFSNNALIYQY